MARKHKIASAFVWVLAGGLLFIVYIGVRYAYVTVPNAYAVWDTAVLVNAYMDAHEGAWPRGWDDLRRTNEASNGPGFNMADLEARVGVDWNADPRALAAMPEGSEDYPPFRVIWMLKGNGAHWSGREPNQMIWYHLQSQPRSAATSKPVKRNE
jgi:hypothetical protein